MFVTKELIIKSPIPEPDVTYTDMWSAIEKALSSADPESILLVENKAGNQISISDFLYKTEMIAKSLTSCGFNRKKPVTIFMGNSIDYLLVLTAVWRLGGFVATINTMSTPDDANKFLTLLESEFLVCDSRTVQTGLLASRGTDVTKIFVKGHHPGCIGLESLYEDSDVSLQRSHQISHKVDTALIQFSSGTTGFPKAVELSHYALQRRTIIMQYLTHGYVKPKHLIVFQSFSHIYGMMIGAAIMFTGCTGIIMPKFDMDEYIQCVVRYKVKQLHFVPPVAVLFVKGSYGKKYDLSHVKTVTCGGAMISETVTDAVIDQIGSHLVFRQGYGMTECQCAALPDSQLLPNVTFPRHCVGLPAPGTAIKVIDLSSGTSLGPMKEGEVCVLSDYRMTGYYQNPEATANTIDTQGWLHTGDIGYYDNNGFLFIVDRIKDLIKYKGYQVAPAELEDMLLKHPAVADAGVVGLPDEFAGELPFAYVVVRTGHSITEKQVTDFVNDKVAKYKQLRGGVKFVREIPKSASGKILRRVIRSEQTSKAAAKL